MAEEYYKTREGKRLLLHAGKTATDKAFAWFSENTIVISDSSGEYGVMVSDLYGTSIAGPLSILASPDQIRIAGLWKVNPLVITSLPSTLYTPIPWLRQSIPSSSQELVNGLSDIARILS